MAHKGKPFQGPEPTSDQPGPRASEQRQLDFELAFYRSVLDRCPDYVEVLRELGNLLTLTGRHREGLQVEKRLCQLRPADPQAHYSLACSYAKLKRADLSLQCLRRALELGYRDFSYLQQDHDLDGIRHDPRFRQLLHEFDPR